MKDHWPAFFDVVLTFIPPVIAVLMNRSTARFWPQGHDLWLLIAGVVVWVYGCALGVGSWYHVDRPGDVNSTDVIKAIGTLWTSILLLGAGGFLMIWSVTWRIARYFDHQQLLRTSQVSAKD